ncbi:restriction endonuclease subunit S [Pseudomonas fluorescens]|jgi:type I restriction enzyme S subunit|uniref:restriction endonuclease subunit S n=1 Tax=Pseudomonas fluorescens TaxID=294 RepID=UPI00125169B2|nr:restriction endonuclease subunit S [Pseudomonas fluorescens]VVP35236.1 Type-1 restriction enzyme EcoKI specificity protein [Pseudomonas fluorescens]
MTFPKYPDYKDSGVKWLSDVPEHWDVRRNKHAFRIVSTLVGSKSKDFQLLSLTLRGVIPRDIESGKGKFPAEFDTYQTVEPDDLVFCLFDIDETPRTVGISGDSGMITGAYTVVRAFASADPRFIYYYYFSIDLRKGLKPFYTGLRKVVRPETFMNIELPLPPLSEQANICDFLDHESARIDALIDEQQRLIELLKEKRQAVISDAVSKGLDPTVPMKDSGVAWLGEVPTHWTIKRLKQLVIDTAGIQMGPFGGMLIDLDDSDTGYKVYGQENTISGNFSSGNRWVAESRYCALSNYHLEVGDIVLTRKGSLGNCRRISFLPQAGIIDSDTIRVRVQEHMMNPDYLELLLHEAGYISTQLSLVKRGAILSGLNSEIIANLVIVAPPREEQKELLQEVSAASSKFDQGISDCEYAMGLLRERRSALISAAVTGKIDVRGWQSPASAPTPELAQEAV